MSSVTRINREHVKQFNDKWKFLYEKFPDMRREAATAAGEAIRRELSVQVRSADLSPGSGARVDGWQDLRIGSRGGYAAISAKSGAAPNPRGKSQPNTYHGKPVTMKQVTRWLERGHGTRISRANASSWARVKHGQAAKSTVQSYVRARQFYSATKTKAVDIGLRAADQLLQSLAIEAIRRGNGGK